ncbi:uncharacterized protein LOC134190191 isoform X2 [Corticium candelabrum]|uniref:uncharacterized protein LOC134190191 isoform X2 n=1 Tax=Corticium candelabrum TaxID=121492 RepID=UPI002E254999|nr:uncharacterized protein LOC134190191 isoform X2 [Corticium candelabrum]
MKRLQNNSNDLDNKPCCSYTTENLATETTPLDHNLTSSAIRDDLWPLWAELQDQKSTLTKLTEKVTEIHRLPFDRKQEKHSLYDSPAVQTQQQRQQPPPPLLQQQQQQHPREMVTTTEPLSGGACYSIADASGERMCIVENL